MPDAPFFSLIVCTLGRREVLGRLLASLHAQTDKDFELLLIDQNPDGFWDGFLGKAEGLNWQHLHSAKGLSRARNVGLTKARGAVMAFPDDDAWYAPDMLARVKARFAACPQADIITCPTRDAQGHLSNGRFLRASGAVGRAEVWRAGNSNGLFVRKAAAERIGGFNEGLGVGSGTAFGAGEETDYLLRAQESGAAILFQDDLFVHHDQVSQKLDAAERARARLYARGFGRVLRLHRFGFAYALYRAGRSALAALLALARGRVDLAWFKMIWAVHTLAGYAAPVYAAPRNLK